MPEGTTLGWYSFEGTVYINQAIAEDPMRTASVINHESTHQLISVTTPHGFVQEALELGRRRAWYDPGSSSVEFLRLSLFEASQFVQEATATYCGLMDYDGDELSIELGRLPKLYRQGFGMYDKLLSQRGLDSLTRYRTARAIGCRAMQTSILDDWLSKGLSELENLRAYLTDTDNSPNDRFIKIANTLRNFSTEALLAWSGQHYKGDDTFVLMPIHPSTDVKIDIHPLPSLKMAQAVARRIVDILCPGLALTEDGGATKDAVEADAATTDALFYALCHPGKLDIAIQPAPFKSINLDIDDTTWAASADLVLVGTNAFDMPDRYVSPSGRYEVPPGMAKLFFYRPDYVAAREYLIPRADLGDFLDRVDPNRGITVCLMGQAAWLDTVASDWWRRRCALLYTGGTQFGFTMACTLLEGIGVPLLTHRMQAGKTWGLALTRSASQDWPMAVHPIIISEWSRIGNIMYELFPLERDTPSDTFFKGGVKSCLPVIRFLRGFRGTMMPESDWQRLSVEAASATVVARHVAVDSRMSPTRFRDVT